MPGVLRDVVATFTHEGAVAFDLSQTDPLTHLTFTQGAALFGDSFYATQVEALRAYAAALLAAERHERGFGWKFATYMRDPVEGKGNRIQGSLAPAILAAADPEGPFTEEYTFRGLRHRADDAVLFVTHFQNLGLGEVPEAARKGLARALAQFDEYQLLKYARRQFPLARRRPNGKHASLRLVDVMGLAKAHLDARTLKLYRYLHAPTRAREGLTQGLALLEGRRAFFQGDASVENFVKGRLSTEQALSFMGSTQETWRRVLDVPGLLPDLAFKGYVRAMYLAGIPVATLVEMARKRRFAGLWPHQVYMGWSAAHAGSNRPGYRAEPAPAIEPVFEAILERVCEGLLPEGGSLGIADISGSMFGASLGGTQSQATVGDAAVTLAAVMARELGYAATFSDDIFVEDRKRGQGVFDLAHALRGGPGWGSTQVAGSVVSLIQLLLAEPSRPRPRTLYFFSDMQFHPPEFQSLGDTRGEAADRKAALLRELGVDLDAGTPPLLAALDAWHRALGPVDVVLWNLAAHDNAPLPSKLPHVLMLAGFDANSFRHVAAWQAAGSPVTPERPSPGVTPSDAGGGRNPDAELDFIRTF
ncbi:hypothetical protein LZ198_13100 [Myxococcus sp. K15C18031901]|uniref:hypothetical protein n=1 Tax=Myxococcus dinghuensis TaxID=2906761 RepID=UPI0020A7BEC0|nr:hypothetical protein [Myxococcus dinghuensis]MCP3099805.1 hypothetical protein [Myxococcus dinghuensis]